MNENEPRDAHGRWVAAGSPTPLVAVSDIAHRADANQVALAAAPIAYSLGFDPKRIDVSDADKTFMLNGEPHKYAGSADLKTGLVTLYSPNLPAQQIPGIVAHEISHQKFEAFMRDYAAERQRLSDDPDAAKGMKADGTLRTPLDAKYPLYNEYTKNFEGHAAEMADQDGVTAYSREWWDAYKSGTATQNQAYHETIAELGKLAQTGEQGGHIVTKPNGFKTAIMPSEKWLKLAKMVNDNWDAKHKND